MELGMIGLGKMGSNMTRRLLNNGHRMVIYDRHEENTSPLEAMGAFAAQSMDDMANHLSTPRAVWIMVPAGQPTEDAVNSLAGMLSSGDTIVDGGNSYYKDSLRRAKTLEAKGISLLDIGVSGGVWGLEEGYCLMAGGDEEAYRRLEPVLKSLAPSENRGFGRVGPSGSGHFVKMVHNAIEYGMMEAYAEGYELMQKKEGFNLDLHQVSEIWQYGSVIRSWLLDLASAALEADPGLDQLESYVADSGEGRWAVQESLELDVPLPVVTLALQARFRSRQNNPFSGRMLAALRQQFGGHKVHSRDE